MLNKVIAHGMGGRSLRPQLTCPYGFNGWLRHWTVECTAAGSFKFTDIQPLP